MLKQRVITALALLVVLVPALVSSDPYPLAVLSLLLCSVATWEWARLSMFGPVSALASAAICALSCALWWYALGFTQPSYSYWLFLSATWVLIGAVLLRLGPGVWLRIYRPLRLFWGFWALCNTWLAINYAKAVGSNFLLSALALVWVADIGAYFVGRAFGHSKLAPRISPGKSWEGVYGGMLAVCLLGVVWTWIDAQRFGVGFTALIGGGVHHADESLYTKLALLGAPLGFAALLLMVAMSVVGDLLESLVKRSVGAKDSSHLLPGHGGVLDRIDALLPTLPMAIFWSLL